VIGSSLFETTAEVSVAFAGFIGIFLILATRDGRFSATDAISIRTIVISSVAPVFYAFLPLLLDFLGISGPTLWRAASSLTALVSIALTAFMFYGVRQLPNSERPGFTLISIVGILCGGFSNLLWLSNALGWPWEPSGAAYLLAVWLVIVIAATHFVVLLFRRVLANSAA